MTATWTSEHLATLRPSGRLTAAVIRPGDFRPIRDDRFYWDFCPVFDTQGGIAQRLGSDLWLSISCPALPVAAERHDHARLRLLTRHGDQWTDHCDMFPDDFSPGSREWAGFAVLNEDDGLELMYTATGVRGEAKPSYRQRIMHASGLLSCSKSGFDTGTWKDLGESVTADGVHYSDANETEGEPGFIKAFRDPFLFRDSATGNDFLLFAATMPDPVTDFAGATGIARRGDGQQHWELKSPLVLADGISNELERPHMVFHKELYYLFWSTHGWTFDPSIVAPTGLYGMVATSMEGPFKPLNDSGLVIANPAAAPYQAYSWMVLPDLSVVSFVDMPDGSLGGRAEGGHPQPKGTFVGTVAPEIQLRLDVDRTIVE